MVMNIESFAEKWDVLTGTVKPREVDRSSLKVCAKALRVGGISVSPSVFTDSA